MGDVYVEHRAVFIGGWGPSYICFASCLCIFLSGEGQILGSGGATDRRERLRNGRVMFRMCLFVAIFPVSRCETKTEEGVGFGYIKNQYDSVTGQLGDNISWMETSRIVWHGR